jgi:hypothetical protein
MHLYVVIFLEFYSYSLQTMQLYTTYKTFGFQTVLHCNTVLLLYVFVSCFVSCSVISRVISHCSCKLFQSAVTVHVCVCVCVCVCVGGGGVPLGCGYFFSYQAVFV